MKRCAFLLRRIASAIPTALGVVTLAFIVLHLAPGDPVTALLGDFNASPDIVAEMRAHYGLDQPIYVQYGLYLLHVLEGDLGTSMRTDQTVVSAIAGVFPQTLILTTAAIILALLIGLPLGTLSAIFPNTVIDECIRIVSLLGMCTPSFVLAIVLILFFAYYLDWFPILGSGDLSDPASALRHLILPAMSLALRDAATISRLTRASMISILSQDFIIAARAKGIPEWRILLKHALRNSLVATITIAALEFGYTLGGTAVIETVFGRPGLGTLMIQAINARDYPQIQGTILVFAFSIILINLLADFLYQLVDPRIALDASA